ncbi:MAG: hypothetical protein ASARMPRED_009016 [Alectoria sarmentosa]|nr:MAG: hypothetical protein ASARMPRED_009016 [Alectoria sarmentosa]
MPRQQRPAFEAAVTASPLFKVAVEVRIMIYELLLIQEGGMFIPSDIFARRDYGRTGSIPNSFHFCDPATASSFRWGTDCAQAGAIQEIGIKFGSQYFKKVTPWVTYLTKRTLSLGRDFPHLRRMTINLGVWLGMSQGLDWVLVLMLSNERVLDCFERLVDREDGHNNGTKEVRRHVWANETGDPWRNALLWWGSPGEVVPPKYRVIGDQPQQQVSRERTDEGGSTLLTAPAS